MSRSWSQHTSGLDTSQDISGLNEEQGIKEVHWEPHLTANFKCETSDTKAQTVNECGLETGLESSC